ncbi:MAG: hypothetical protein RL389_752 [Actinomycetota bacterium]|jgi:UDP-N-acetylglucosamine 2-epimerase (non-hydrolysing)
MKKILFIYGTRPEAIKMAPLVKLLQSNKLLDVSICITGQHKEMVEAINCTFEIKPNFDIDVFKPGQSLSELSAAIISKLKSVIETNAPDVVVVQGDTTSAFCGAYVGFLLGARVVHLEAGLRSENLRDPFPEEVNRKLISQLTDLHLAPTSLAAENLIKENVEPASIYVAGNTVIDALLYAKNKLPLFESENRVRRILLTIHRRENLASGLGTILLAIANLAENFPEVAFDFPMHPNPRIREKVIPALGHLQNVNLLEPLGYSEMIEKINASYLVLTDSGGLQEEAPALGKPVLVLRNTTERPEGIHAGTARLVGTETDNIINQVALLLNSKIDYDLMARASNPYGDGFAAQRAESAILELLNHGARLPEFS